MRPELRLSLQFADARHRAVLLYGVLASPAVLFVVWTMGAAPRVAALVAATEQPAAFERLEGRLEEQRRARREASVGGSELALAGAADGTDVERWRAELAESFRLALATDAPWTWVDLYGPEGVASNVIVPLSRFVTVPIGMRPRNGGKPRDSGECNVIGPTRNVRS